MRKSFFVSSLFVFSILFSSVASAEPDTLFKQAVSVKYEMPESLKGITLKKTVTDYNDIVYVLADNGLYRVFDKQVAKDIRYTPLAKKIPVDIAVQEGAKHLYYLYEDEVLTNGYAGAPFSKLPKGKYSMLAVAANGNMLLAGKDATDIFTGEKWIHLAKPNDSFLCIAANDGAFYALSKDAVYKLDGNNFKVLHEGNDLHSMSFKKDEIILGTSKGYYGISKKNGDTSFTLQTKVPVENINCLSTVNNKIWAGTNEGAYMRQPEGSYRYYASKRWLNEDKVISITSDSKGNVYLLTSTGLNKIEFISQTLAGKAKYFQEDIRQRHIRYGFISNITFAVPGDITTSQLTDTDNDGLWSSFYLGSQAFRYAVTKDTLAKRYAWEAFEAFERLISINPLKGFPARTFERIGFKHSDPERWHESPNGQWEWKGTTSSDEFVAYIWVAAVMNDMAAETSAEKKRVADFMDKILMHIIDNNYYFIDADGKPTMWGKWNPEYINSFPPSVGDRKLGSTTIIAGLQLGYASTGKELYKKEALRLMNDHGYLKNILVPCENLKPTKVVLPEGVVVGEDWNHSDDEMAFLTYWVLYNYAFNNQLKKQYADVIRDHWQIEKPERNALWNLISLGTSGAFDKESTLWHLRGFPMDLIRWNIKNSNRKDIVLLPPNFREQRTKELLPPDEVPMHRHNTNAFILDGGDGGKEELAGDEYLLPYWMARYLKVLE
ncbi:MAG: hypothetical protein ACTHJ5_17625 [Ilyomonas sp.]